MSELRRVAVVVPDEAAEETRARFVELFPAGFEEVEHPGGVELAAYVDASAEEQLREALAPRPTTSTPVADDWPDRWRSFHRGARVGPLWIGPPWEQPPGDTPSVVVDPGRAFGTGAHATTRLCLELLAGLPRGSLLDVGCGSGVLAIAGVKLGFDPVLAVDDDPAAVEVARENAEANAVAVDVRRADAVSDVLPAADVAVANVSLEVVRAVAPRLAVRRLVTSGYLTSDDLELRGFVHRRRVTDGGWAADLHEK